jgi:chemotaxis protein CheX
MANIIGGNVKALLPEPSVLSLPQVDLEHGALSVPSAQLVSQADLRWDGQPVRISVWGNA